MEDYLAAEAAYFDIATPRQRVVLCAMFQRGKRAMGLAPLERPMSVGEAAEMVE